MGAWVAKLEAFRERVIRPHDGSIPFLRSQTFISLVFFLFVIAAAWKVAGWISAGETNMVVFAAMAFVLCGIGFTIIKSWRAGFYLFVVWLLFEDLIRKYLGNNMAIYFAKDALVGLTYISLLLAIRRGKAKAFRPPFLLTFSLFFWLAALQVFNPYSPSILYGLLGMKLYFYYAPLMFVGYALIRDDRDLWRFLIAFMALAGVISTLGIVQGVIGPTFLSPATLAPDIRELGSLEKTVPLTNQMFLLPSSVFVSSGRFAFYLVLATIVGLGAAGYFVLSKLRKRKFILAGIALIAIAVLLSGSRTALMYFLISMLVMAAAYLWGVPVQSTPGRRLMKSIRRSIGIAAVGLAIFVAFFPSAAASRFDFYSETLLPNSSAYELSYRAWNYPLLNLMDAFSRPHWIVGNGTGTASLGVQYVSKLTGPPPDIGVEEGYGQLIVEMGILAPILWILWTASLVWACWKIVGSLRQTRLFPVAMAIFWYAFVLLYPLAFLGLDIYQNFVNNAFLWILVGVLFRLPEITANQALPNNSTDGLRALPVDR
ncbi:MAG TPA: hypothetical protein VGR81_10985 [Candidatus Acidoferrales bacterium]|nr:hypothetical protein [Candidatus Acidoferrales bacterium]